VHDAVFINPFSEMAHINALSTVLNEPIRSYYPPQANPEISSEVFTRRVVGRGVRDCKCDVVLMWTVVNFDPCRYISNHFVPLVDRYVDVCGFSISVVTAAPFVVEIEDESLQKSSAVVDKEHVPIATIVDESCEDTPSDTGLPNESVVEDSSIHDTSGGTCQTQIGFIARCLTRGFLTQPKWCTF